MKKSKLIEIRIPKSTITPINRRILVKAEKIANYQTRTGIFLPGSVKSDKGKIIDRTRYYVIAVADDVNFILSQSIDPYQEPVQIERGDMVWCLDMPDSIEFKLPQILDWEADTEIPVFNVIEIHELAGVRKMKDIKDRKIILE